MIFLTGGSGFLGVALIDKFIELKQGSDLCVLVRGKSEDESIAKLKSACKKTIEKFGEEYFDKHVKVIQGDLIEERLGISKYNTDYLKENVNSIYNNAANTNLGAKFDEISDINIGGTKKVLNLAKEISLKNNKLKFYHVSTAYVAGDQHTEQLPSNLDLDIRFRNAYEQSKAIAESYVRNYINDFQIVTYRPSIIVGDSKTGVTSAFNVLYIPARIIISGLLKAIPALPHTPFDVVPVDYVAESIVKAHGIDVKSGSSFYLSSGIGRESSPNEILDLLFNTASNCALKHLPIRPSFISPEKVNKALTSVSSLAQHVYQSNAFKNFEKIVCEKLPVFRQLMPLIPYMISNPRFNNRTTISTFSNTISEAPLFINYGENIFRYCFQTDWGKKAFSSI